MERRWFRPEILRDCWWIGGFRAKSHPDVNICIGIYIQFRNIIHDFRRKSSETDIRCFQSLFWLSCTTARSLEMPTDINRSP